MHLLILKVLMKADNHDEIKKLLKIKFKLKHPGKRWKLKSCIKLAGFP